jgi:hypothetical protein
MKALEPVLYAVRTFLTAGSSFSSVSTCSTRLRSASRDPPAGRTSTLSMYSGFAPVASSISFRPLALSVAGSSKVLLPDVRIDATGAPKPAATTKNRAVPMRTRRLRLYARSARKPNI